MRVLSTKSHGIFDLAAGGVLVVSPWVLGYYARGVETWVPVLLGLALIVYSLITDYEIAAVRRLQLTVHLWMDAVAGLLLGVSPWLFAFDDEVWLPHLVIGVLLLVAAAFSDTIPGYERRGAARAEG